MMKTLRFGIEIETVGLRRDQLAMAISGAVGGPAATESYGDSWRVTDAQGRSWRVVLLRLGLIGDEFKTARLHLTKRLAGSAAWKRGRRDRTPPAPSPTASAEDESLRAAA